MFLLFLGTALAGYGDAPDGHPTRGEREVHVWIDAVRADPAAFESDYRAYPGHDCSSADFTDAERTSKGPLRYDPDLARVAAEHSLDMRDNGVRGHTSSDGRSPEERIREAFDGGHVGETVAFGFPSLRNTVLRGLICSAEHRAILLSDGWDLLGAGVVEDFVTVDLGEKPTAPRALTMGVHLPEGEQTTLLADVDGMPSRIDAVVDGERVPMALRWGTAEHGVYAAAVPTGGCTPYYFEAEVDGATVRFPEDGAFGWGPCAYDDAGAGWFADRDVSGFDVEGAHEDTGVGGPELDCGGQGSGLGAVGALLLALVRRRGWAR